MKSAIVLSVLVASAFAAATPPYANSPGNPLFSGGSSLPSHEYVTLQFSNDLSSQPSPVNVNFTLGEVDRSVLVDPTKLASSVQVVDQSHAVNGFYCSVRVLGQGDATHHVNPINTFRSFGASVPLGSVFVRCTSRA